jgi:hypothetical protein
MIRFRCFCHFRIPQDTNEHVSHIRASPNKHRNSAEEQTELCSDKSALVCACARPRKKYWLK